MGVKLAPSTTVEVMVAILLPVAKAKDWDKIVSYDFLEEKLAAPRHKVQSVARRAIKRIRRECGLTFEVIHNQGYRLANVTAIKGMCESGRRSILRKSKTIARTAQCVDDWNKLNADDRNKLVGYIGAMSAIAAASSASALRSIESKASTPLGNGVFPKLKTSKA